MSQFPPNTMPCRLGVACDGDDFCDNGYEADLLIGVDDDRATRLGYILDDAAGQGWLIVGRQNPETALAFCPEHRAQQEKTSKEPA